MAEFINFEAEADDVDEIEMDDDPIFDDPMLIDDAEDQPNNEPSFFRFFNQTTDTEEVLAAKKEQQREAIKHLEPANYLVPFEEFEQELDESALSEINKEKFKETLINPIEEQIKENSFFSALIYALIFSINKEADAFSDEEIENKTGESLFEKLLSKKNNCILDLDRANLDNLCFDLNEILVEFNFFLRVSERKDKFRYLFHQN